MKPIIGSVTRFTAVVLFDNVIEILRLTKFDGQAGVLTDAANGSGVSTAFVDGDLLRQTLQVDCTRQIAPRPPSCLAWQSEGSHRITSLVHCTVQIFPLD